MSATPSTLADLASPHGSYPELWPIDTLRDIAATPTRQLTVVQRTPGTTGSFRRCALIPINRVSAALDQTHSWARDIGDVEAFDGEFCTGLVEHFTGTAEFFCQLRHDPVTSEPTVDWSLPFLWYWRAFRRNDQWIFLDSSGRDRELARVYSTATDDYRVEVDAMALRHYLKVRGMVLLLDFQYDQNHPDVPFRGRDERLLECDWASMTFAVYYDDSRWDEQQTASWLYGQYVVLPAEHADGPAGRTRDEPAEYTTFIYDTDAATGRELIVSLSPEEVGSDGSPGPHFWTRIFFRPEVLERYLADPDRYVVTSSDIRCLDRWILSIGRTSDGLVEVDLYDLSLLPWREWSHWRAHNVAPSGRGIDEGKLRRERLNQPASSPDIVRELRAARQAVDEAFQRREGWHLWKTLVGHAGVEWDALHPPVGESRTALQGPLLTLCKAIVDALNSSKLKRALTTPPPDNTQSLAALSLYLEQIGGDADLVKPLRDIYRLRSAGGFAHYGGSRADEILREFITGRDDDPATVFHQIIRRLVDSLTGIAGAVANTNIASTAATK